MPRELTDEQWNHVQGRMQVADFVESIYNDPQLNTEAKRLIKKKYPNLKIADLDLEDKIESRFAEADNKKTEAERRRREADEDAAWKADRARVQKDYRFTDDAMARLEKLMVDKKIGDYEVAASYMAAKEPPTASDPTYDPTRWHHGRQEGFAEIAKDPEAWGRTELFNAIQKDQQTQKGQR